MKLLSYKELHSLTDIKFTNELDQEIVISHILMMNGVKFITYTQNDCVRLITYDESDYTIKLFSEKPEEEYFEIGDEIDDGVFLFAVEERRKESVLCLALCVNLGRSYPHPYNRFRNPEHLKYVCGKGFPKSEISKIYTYDNN